MLFFVINACKTSHKLATEDKNQTTEPQIDTLWLEPLSEQKTDTSVLAREEGFESLDTIPQTVDSLVQAIDTLLQSTDSIQKPGDTLQKPAQPGKPERKVVIPRKSDNAFEVKVNRTAVDSVVQDMSKKLIYYYGKAVVKYDDIVLEASYLEFDLKTNVVTAKGIPDSTGRIQGAPVFTQGETKFEASEMSYNFQTKKGVIKKVWTEESGGYLHGEKIKRMDDNTIHIKSGGYTTCNLKEHPHFQFRFSKAKVIPNDKIVTGPVYLTIADVPLPIGLPFALFPNSKGQKSGLIVPSYGESENRGFYLENGGYYWAINDRYDLQVLGDIYTRGSWAIKPTFRYNQRYKHNGSLALGFAVNKIGDEGAADYNKSSDFKVKWTHKQDTKAHPRHSFSADVNVISSNFNKYNATTSNEYLSNTFKSSIAYQTNFGGKVYLTLNASHSQNTLTKQVTVSLPEMTVTVNRFYPLQKLKNSRGKLKGLGKQLSNLNMSYTMNAKNYISGVDTLLFPTGWYESMSGWFNNLQNYTQNGIKHTIPINLPLKLFKHFTWTNSATFNDYMYFTRIEQNWNEADSCLMADTLRGFNNLVDFNFSSNLTTKVYGMVNFRKGPIRAIRHVFTPTIGFSYRPDFSDPKWHVYNTYVDGAGELQTYNMFVNTLYGTPSQNKSGQITYSFTNTLDMKVPSKSDTVTGVKKVVLLESLGFSGNYNLTQDSLNFSNLSVNARTTLFKKLHVTYSSVWDPYVMDSMGKRVNRFEIIENQRLFHKNNSAWNFSLSWSFSQNDLKQLKSKRTRTENDEFAEFNDRISQRAAGSEFITEGELDDILGNPKSYIDWNTPWSLTLSYNLRHSSSLTYAAFMGIATNQIVQTLTVNGDISLSKKWKVTFSTGWDFTNHGLSYTSLDIYRDLHCWEMRFNWIPIGNYKSWNFTINVKAQALQDLKLTKKKDYRDN
ncbi:MAG: LPS-assembly protein LptD [Bacteroidales bacterium]|nr:LPS-assembly protein LptD [Bacteroidales bacterium]